MAFALASVAVTCLNAAYNLAAIAVFRAPDFLTAVSAPEREALGYLFLRLHSYGNTVNEMFWGLWLLPFGILVIKSRFIPRLLGALPLVGHPRYRRGGGRETR